MRFHLSIALTALACASLQAQSSNFEDSEMWKRTDSSFQKVRAAVNAYAEGKKEKEDPSLASSMKGKTYQGTGKDKFDKKSGVTEFRYKQKPGPGTEDYKMTRKFFGIKNPWIGSKTYEAPQANLKTKGRIANVDREFTDKTADTSAFYQANKNAPKQDDLRIKTDAVIVQGGAQGALNQINDRVGKEMTIDQVRDLLNKDRKISNAGSR